MFATLGEEAFPNAIDYSKINQLPASLTVEIKGWTTLEELEAQIKAFPIIEILHCVNCGTDCNCLGNLSRMDVALNNDLMKIARDPFAFLQQAVDAKERFERSELITRMISNFRISKVHQNCFKFLNGNLVGIRKLVGGVSVPRGTLDEYNGIIEREAIAKKREKSLAEIDFCIKVLQDTREAVANEKSKGFFRGIAVSRIDTCCDGFEETMIERDYTTPIGAQSTAFYVRALTR